MQTDGAAVGEWTMDYEAAKELAAEKKLPLMLNFTGSDWCHWCKLMDGKVFAKDEWKEFAAENAVLVTIDFPRDESIVPAKYVARNRGLQQQFGVQGFPTYVILDSDGETKLGQLSAGEGKTPGSFIDEFGAAVKMSERGVEAYAKANPDKADAFRAAVKEMKDAKKALMDWVETGPQRNEKNNELFAGFQKRIREAGKVLAAFD